MRAEPLVEIKKIPLNYHSDEGEIAALKDLRLWKVHPAEHRSWPYSAQQRKSFFKK